MDAHRRSVANRFGGDRGLEANQFGFFVRVGEMLLEHRTRGRRYSLFSSWWDFVEVRTVKKRVSTLPFSAGESSFLY